MPRPSAASTLISSATASTAPALVQLERQVERGNLFAHSALGENFIRLGEVEVFLHGLIDALLAKGLVTGGEIETAVSAVRSELQERDEKSATRVMIRPDNQEESKASVQVDCRARMHVCHAVCCKLTFALNIPEVEEGKIKWDLGRPYFIRHDSHGCCAHLDAGRGRCQIYEDRPGVCKNYSCANDDRIWKDFQKMELNTEWIDTNLASPTGPHVARAWMHGQAATASSSKTNQSKLSAPSEEGTS